MQISARNSLKGKIKSIEDARLIRRSSSNFQTAWIVVPDYHERFGGTLEFERRQNGLRRRQSERRDDCDGLIFNS